MENETADIVKTKNIISIKGAKKSFGKNQVLTDATLDIKKGENLVILGKSGTGKSVLIKMIAGLIKPDAGNITVFGKDVESLDRKSLDDVRLKIGFSFQSAALYDSMTVRENIAFPLIRNNKRLSADEVEKAVRKALEDVDLEKTIDQMPAELSGGQRKRVGIARALIMKPEIMMYDEPTSGLDPITSTEINNLINHVQETYHTTAIIITHDLTCAKATGNRIAVLMDGTFVATGTFDEVFKDNDNEKIKSFYEYNFIL